MRYGDIRNSDSRHSMSNVPTSRSRINPNSSIRFVFILIVFVASYFSLFLYSFTQVDLNLTLSTVSLLYGFQDYFQYIGYFDRPFSAQWYSTTVLILVILYGYVLSLATKRTISLRTAWILVLVVVAALAFSYPAFSYDIYNYLFDARIITRYGENPYVHKALDYPEDPWIHFMRWTHRVYPYGPVWLAFSVPLSFAGMEKLLPTLLAFKSLAVFYYLVTSRMIVGIMKNIQSKMTVVALSAFALNPLVVIESLVSAHNDIVMMGLAFVSFYFLTKERWGWSLLFLILSIGIKFATVFVVPVYILVFIQRWRKNKVSWEKVILLCLIAMTGAVVAATVRTQFQPWYLLYIFPFAALLSHRIYIRVPVVILTLCGLSQYIPFLYLGNWDPPVPKIIDSIMIAGVVISLASIVWYYKIALISKKNT